MKHIDKLREEIEAYGRALLKKEPKIKIERNKESEESPVGVFATNMNSLIVLSEASSILTHIIFCDEKDDIEPLVGMLLVLLVIYADREALLMDLNKTQFRADDCKIGTMNGILANLHELYKFSIARRVDSTSMEPKRYIEIGNAMRDFAQATFELAILHLRNKGIDTEIPKLMSNTLEMMKDIKIGC